MENRTDLPYRPRDVRDDDDLDDYYGPEDVVARCHYTGKPPRDVEPRRGSKARFTTYGKRLTDGQGECPYCHGAFDVVDGVLVEHGRLLAIEEQAEAIVDEIAALLGLADADAGRRANYATSGTRLDNRDLIVASALPHLIAGLVARGSMAEATRAVTDLSNLVIPGVVDAARSNGIRSGAYADDAEAAEDVPEDAPLFSEAVLYPLVGKDEARSVLGLLRRARSALGV